MQLPSSISTRLEYQHKSLIEIIEGLNDQEIRKQIIPGKWSIFENIVHLSTYQHVFSERINKLLKDSNPQFPRYTAEADPLFLDNCEKSTREIVQDLIMTRREIISHVLGLNGTELLRTGSHPIFGQMTISQWVNFFLLHEAHHLFTIFKLAAEIRNKQTG